MDPGHTYVVFREDLQTAYGFRIAKSWFDSEHVLVARIITHYESGVPTWGERSSVLLCDAERDYKRLQDPKKAPYQ